MKTKLLLLCTLFTFSYQMTEPALATIKGEKFKNSNDFLLQRVAFKFSGTFRGIKEKRKQKTYRVTECNFSYEKGKQTEHKTEREYFFERFNVGYEGIDKEGVTFFDSVSYMNSNYIKNFVAFDFSQSFGPVDLNSVIKFDPKEKDGTIKFVKGAGKSAVMQFKHTDVFGTDQSKFFDYGERRNFTVQIFFDEYGKNITLGKVSVLIESEKLDKFGSYSKSVPVADIKCSQFKALPEM